MRAIGAADWEPKPPFSTSTARAIFGCSAGAKAMNSAWSRSSSLILCALYSAPLRLNTCAVPVFPPETYSAPAKALAPVPSLLTPTMALLIVSMFCFFHGRTRSGSGSIRVFSPLRLSVMWRTRCGRYSTPSLASAAMACASWIGV